MVEQLVELLEFNPVLVMAFAGMSMLTVQILKQTLPIVSKYSMAILLAMALFFAVMIVLEVMVVLQVSLISFVILTSAMGIYEGSKKKESK